MLALTLAAALALEPKARPPRVEFAPATVEWSRVRGASRLYGQAFLKTRGGSVKTCAGNEVYLVPDSPYSRYRMQLLFGGNERGFLGPNPTFAQLEAPEPEFETYVRTATCDAEGRFSFNRLPGGRYYVVALVAWEAATGWRGAGEVQGGRVMKSVVVSDDDEQDVVVTW